MATGRGHLSVAKARMLVCFFAAIGLLTGGVGGYLGYSLLIVGQVPLLGWSQSPTSPLEETYNGMARLGSLEEAARACGGVANADVIEQEGETIERIERSSKAANLTPPLAVALAIMKYRVAERAKSASDPKSFDSAMQEASGYLRAAGWNQTSPEEVTAIIRDLDQCSEKDRVTAEEK